VPQETGAAAFTDAAAAAADRAAHSTASAAPRRARPRRHPAAAVPSDDEIFAKKTVAELNQEHPLAEVTRYDLSDLTDASRTTLQKDADWLRRPTSSDRRGPRGFAGTNEYNLSLGERRVSRSRLPDQPGHSHIEAHHPQQR
jgi:hypothetical protein